MANEAFQIFDSIVFGWILRPPKEEDLISIKTAAVDSHGDPNHRQFIYDLMNALDTKTSALLTHISLIVAALTFLYTSQSGGWVFKRVVIIELCAYLLLSIFCLRSIRMTSGLLRSQPTAANALEEELYKRRTVYNWTSNTTIYVTVGMIVTLLVEAFVA